MADVSEHGLAANAGPVEIADARRDLAAAPHDQMQAKPGNYKWKVLSIVMIGTIMIVLDSTVVNVAFRTLQLEFGGSLTDSQWVLSIYVLALGIATPVSGFLGDRFGVKRVYLAGLALFAVGSFLCGIAPTLGVLIAMRALQGLGGGMAQPLGPAMVYRNFPPREQGLALGIFGISLVVGPAMGPILGGLLVDANLWRFIFFINVPIGIVAVMLGTRFLREGRADRKPSLDVPGLLLSAIGFGSLLYAATNAENYGWGAPTTVLFFLIGFVGVGAFCIVELFVAKEPLLDLRLFKNPIFTNASFIGYVSVLALFGAEFLMPLYLQLVRGQTALETGVVLLALAVASGITTPIAGRLYDKIGPRAIVTFGFALVVINTWQLAQLQANTPFLTIVLLLGLRGLAFGLTVQSTFTTALGTVPLTLLPRGSSLVNSTRFVVQAIAVALLATVLASALSPQILQLQTQIQANPISATARFGLCETPGVAPDNNLPPGAADGFKKLPTAQQASAKQQTLAGVQLACQEYITGFERAYQVTFLFAIISMVLSAFLPGWPGTWAGRGNYRQASAGSH